MSNGTLTRILTFRADPEFFDRVGADKRRIAENAVEKAEAFQQGREGVDNVERLVQVGFSSYFLQ